MKLATLPDTSTRDGRLVVVSKDLGMAVDARAVAPTMQAVLENWTASEAQLERLYSDLNSGTVKDAFAFEETAAAAPLPRAWQWLDGSAFDSHGELMAAVFGIEDPSRERPLMYQGTSDRFFGPYEDVPFRNTDDGVDFEGEFAIVTDTVPMGASPAAANEHIKLIMIVNDWSLRTLAPIEMKTGFGWIQAKPPCSASPVAVTPEELGPGWRDSRVTLPLLVDWNGERFGAANGSTMTFGFNELVAHAAATRELVAGTVLGSGTVSNPNYREIGSSCIAERRGIEKLDLGEPKTPFMEFGDTVRMETLDGEGRTVFGAIDQKVVKA